MGDRRNGARRLVDIAGEFLKVKDWREFQHYHDRNPAWIKLHKKILDNPDFQMLPVASRALAPMLWLLASEHHEGLIPWTPANICWRLRMKESEFLDALEELLTKGFFVITDAMGQDASTSLALMEHPASLEKEKNREEEDKEARAVKDALADWIPPDKWNAFIRMRAKIRAPISEHGKYLAMLELSKLRASGQDPGAVLDQSVMRSYKGLFPVNGVSNGKPESGWEAADKRVAERLGETH